MRCPNCSAECSDQAKECDFCGHEFVEGAGAPAVTPTNTPSTSGRAVFTASEPNRSAPEASYRAPPPPPPPVSSENPYAASYPSSSKPASYTAGSVPNYLVWAILATLCCCIPGGIVAIVYAAQVDGKLAAGDYEGALSSSKNAKMWSWISFGVGGFFSLIYFIAVLTGAAADAGRY